MAKMLLLDTDAAQEAIDSHHGPAGVTLDLVTGDFIKIRLTAKRKNVYEGQLLDGTNSAVVVDLDTGEVLIEE